MTRANRKVFRVPVVVLAFLLATATPGTRPLHAGDTGPHGGQTSRPANRPDASAEEPSEPSREKNDPYGWSWVPAGGPFSTKETNLGFGALVLFSFYLAKTQETRPSSVSLRLAYTTRNQAVFAVEPRFFFEDSRYALLSRYEFRFFPNRFYGLGNQAPDLIQDYTEERIYLDTEFQRRLLPDFFLGLRHELDRLEVIRLGIPPNPPRPSTNYLNQGEVPGDTGELLNGFGPTLVFDRRDSQYSATRGHYYRAGFLMFPAFAGSPNQSFARLAIDLRHYIPLFRTTIPLWDSRRTHVLAAQFYGEYVLGDSPFQALPTLGGPRQMRGYFRGRFRDNYYSTAQIEYRLPLLWRIDAAGFFSAANIAGPNSVGGDGSFTFTTGGGLRGIFDKEQRTVIRVDFGISGAGDTAVIFNRSEAF